MGKYLTIMEKSLVFEGIVASEKDQFWLKQCLKKIRKVIKWHFCNCFYFLYTCTLVCTIVYKVF